MATAAATTVAQVHELVHTGSLDPEAVVTPSIFVDRVVCVAARHHRAGSALMPLSPDELAAVVARDISPHAYVNLGIGQPTKVPEHLSPESGIVLHPENGMLGMGPAAVGDGSTPT